ncbi:GntR family transcriptional regulator [Palleronia abyssalis]|uniref:Putative D-xylose utilization operon transcriptional repressor n=1 Tax=Palleronia abyssalis TaxID=1501240 RepID=A0A2R8C0B3_9RHOB|nr:GntR family transcriptional regulator [Palleronia abyssalis]SPJ25842.1 putative D-xylose utilization operon transcriptional repressor [Palleronia abyssalis]
MSIEEAGTATPMEDIGPIENVPLRVQVANRLRTAILSGRLKPGTSLVETALADQMNVSRAPIREAIQILENDGLVETIAYKGKRVKPLTAREVEEVYSLREAFEVMAVQRIIERNTPVDALRAPCEAMLKAAGDDDLEGLVAGDEAFHRTLIEIADHDLLAASWKSLYLRIHQIMALRSRKDHDLQAIASNHPPIVDALAARDMDRAVNLISAHTRNLKELDPETIAKTT